jgi:hypothetical protein
MYKVCDKRTTQGLYGVSSKDNCRFAGGDHAGETFNIILPFSMAMSLHMWPIDSKKRLYLSTSPIIFQVKSSCWNNLRGLCDLYQADPSQQIEVARNDLLEGVAKDDLRCMPSIFLPGGSMSDLTGELHIELLVDNISSRSISWTYRNPRSIKHISFQVCSQVACICVFPSVYQNSESSV